MLWNDGDGQRFSLAFTSFHCGQCNKLAWSSRRQPTWDVGNLLVSLVGKVENSSKCRLLLPTNTSVHLVIAKAICISNELLSFFQQLAWARVKRPSRPFCCLPNLFGRLSRLARPKPGLVWAAKLLGGESRSFMSNDKGPDPIINHLLQQCFDNTKLTNFYLLILLIIAYTPLWKNRVILEYERGLTFLKFWNGGYSYD